ncbi:MAG: hypothetical protein KJO79_01735 [Verrucomicrobiae bacterium]|nr:hypothetical protein [Verrucomicrobiae bacterium]NNJ85869.1 hypothetical protein [Akkermansiaceae bacterium]
MSVLIILGHGSSKHPDSSRSVRMHADILNKEGKFNEVRCAFLKEQPMIDGCLDGLENESVVLVPDFLAEGYFTRQVIPKKLNLDSLPNNIRYCPPVGTHPLMADLIVESTHELLGDWKLEQTSLLVVGHGSKKNPCSKQTLLSHLDVISRVSGFADVSDLWLEEAPYVNSWSESAAEQQVIILPFLLNDGQHGGWDIPQEIGIMPQQKVHGVTHVLEGKHVRIAPALGKSPRFAEVIDAMAEIWTGNAGL